MWHIVQQCYPMYAYEQLIVGNKSIMLGLENEQRTGTLITNFQAQFIAIKTTFL